MEKSSTLKIIVVVETLLLSIVTVKLCTSQQQRASSMRNLEASLTWKEDILNECFDEKKTVEERNENLDHDLDKKLADLVNLQGANIISLG